MRPATILSFVMALGTGVTAVWAAPTAEQRAEIQALGTLLTKAGSLYKEQKFKEAGELVKEVQERLAKLASGADSQLLAQLQPLHKRLVNAYALLELEGIALPELVPLEKPASKGARRGMSTVSFVRDVAPILNNRCGGCHVRNARGMFSMATYESLMKGPPAGKVVFPGNVEGSDLIVKVQDKEMPPNGAGIPDAELEILKRWVQEGALFDGPSPTAQLTTYLPTSPAATPAPAAPANTVQMATGKETVSFARDIAPVLAEKCTGCHGNDNPRNNLNLNSMASLLRGGDRGEPVLPGKPADSLLIKKLKGTADGARMPQRQPPLDDATIARFEKWIEEGARFDGLDAAQPVAEVAAIAKAQRASHEELKQERVRLAEENWRLGIPEKPPQRAESPNFLVLGTVGENTLTDIAKRAEALVPRIAEMFRAPRDQPLVKGRITLFVFSDRYDYTEFGKMVEKRDVPASWRGHFRYSIVDAYGVLLLPRSGDYSLDALIGQQVAAVYVASLGRTVPRWFAEGCGRVAATRLASGADGRIAEWDQRLSGIVSGLAAPDDFLTGKLPPEDADICSFSFAKFLMSDPRRFAVLLDGLRKGTDFSSAFAAAYGATPGSLAARWAYNPPKAGGRRTK
jgi:hypothetical protein